MTKWPEKKESPTGKDCNCMAHYYGECSCGADWSDNDQWNLCHDAFMKVINEQQLQPLDEEELAELISQSSLYDDAWKYNEMCDDNLNMIIKRKYDLARIIIKTFGIPKQQKPLNEKLVRHALETKHGLTDHQSMLLWHTISEFGIPKQQEVSVEEIIEKLDKYWSFDDNQQHTHTWHTKQDFMTWLRNRIYGKGK